MKYFKSLSLSALAIVILLLTSLAVSTALADTVGPNDPGLGENNADIGTVAWDTPGNIQQADNNYATATIIRQKITTYIEGTQYGFNIPLNASISGIEVQVKRGASHSGQIVDYEIRLVNDGVIVGATKAITTTWTTTFTVATYGGPIDLWGTSWTPDDINKTNFGAVLAAIRTNNGSTPQLAMVDSMKIKVYYEVSSRTHVTCDTPVVYGNNSTCTAIISHLVSETTPTGTVNWSTDGTGTFDQNQCTVPDGFGVAACSVVYTPSEVGTATHTITAAYSGDSNYSPSSDNQAITVNRKDASVTPDAQTKVYGAADPTLTGTLNGFLAGDNVTATYSRTAGETVLGSPYTISATLLPVSVLSNYNITNNTANFTITKASAACSVSGYSGTYDAVPHGATGSCSGIGGESAGTLNLGAAYTNVPGGSSHWVFTGNSNYDNQSGDVAINIDKANATCIVTPYVVEYDRLSHTATGTCIGVVSELLVGLNLTGTSHTQIGNYPADGWTFTSMDGNYNDSLGSVSDKITVRMITVTADAKSKVAGQPDPALTYQVTTGSLLTGDSFSGTLVRQTGEQAGTYPILQGSLSLSGYNYYSLTYVHANLTILSGTIYFPMIIR